MQNLSKKSYNISRKTFVKYIRHTLNTTLKDIYNGKNLLVERNKSNPILYEIILLSDNNFWRNWLENNEYYK